MTAEQGADERRIRSLLRRRGVGPDASPPQDTAGPAVQSDWWNRLYADDDGPEHDEQPAGEGHWYSVRKDPEAVPVASSEPGVHVIINPPPAAHASPRRSRLRRWILHRVTAAAAGYVLGLGPAIGRLLTDAGPGAVGAALLFYWAAWIAATRLLRLVPSEAVDEVHIAADWAAHLPSATVLLALALHTPNAVGVTP